MSFAEIACLGFTCFTAQLKLDLPKLGFAFPDGNFEIAPGNGHFRTKWSLTRTPLENLTKTMQNGAMRKRYPLKSRAKERLKELAWRPVKCPVGTAIFVIGLSGVSGDAAAWERALDRVTADERTLALAERAADFGLWANQLNVRIAFVLAGVLLILWRLQWFWRFRHKLIFNWRRLLAEEVWIDRMAALKVLRNSTWGELKKPVRHAFEGLTLNLQTGLSPADRQEKKFSTYLQFALESFEANNPQAVRQTGDGKEYEEGALRRFSHLAMRREVIEQFGEIPEIKV